jgi:hypothetical protein
MEELVKFLPGAKWQERGQHTSICDDQNLESILVKCASEIPLSLEGFGVQAWKTTGSTLIREEVAYIIPVSIIEGTPRILGGPPLVPAKPLYFEKQTVISGFLYYLLAKPPATKVSESNKECLDRNVSVRFDER